MPGTIDWATRTIVQKPELFFRMADDTMRKATKQEVAQASLVNPFVRSCLVF